MSPATPAGDFIAAGVETLFAAHAGFDRQRVAIIGSDDGGNQAIIGFQLDQQHAFAGAGEEVDLIRLAEQHAAAGAGGDDGFGAADDRGERDLRAFHRACVAPA